MPNLTLAISRELKAEMKRHYSIKWSSVVRNIIEQKLADFEESEKIENKSKLTMKDLKSISDKVSKNAAKHARALLDESNG